MLILNGQQIEITHFPDSTSQVWKLSPELLTAPKFHIVWKFSTEAELIYLAQLKALLDLEAKATELEITYLPYARQDKEISNASTFALRPFAHLLNSLKFDDVILHDPHSSVALSEIRNARAVYPIKRVNQIVKLLGVDLICYPDKGARARYDSLYQTKSIYGEKVRDQSNGRITSYEVIGDPSQKRILIVDDICDGGATFTVLARDLIGHGAQEVHLFVTHGIFSKGLAGIREAGVRRIFTSEGEAFENQTQITFKEI